MSDDTISNADQDIEDETLYAALAGAPECSITLRHIVSAEGAENTARRLYDIDPSKFTIEERLTIQKAAGLLRTLVSENEVTIHR